MLRKYPRIIEEKQSNIKEFILNYSRNIKKFLRKYKEKGKTKVKLRTYWEIPREMLRKYPRAKSQEPRAKRQEPRAKSQEPRDRGKGETSGWTKHKTIPGCASLLLPKPSFHPSQPWHPLTSTLPLLALRLLALHLLLQHQSTTRTTSPPFILPQPSSRWCTRTTMGCTTSRILDEDFKKNSFSYRPTQKKKHLGKNKRKRKRERVNRASPSTSMASSWGTSNASLLSGAIGRTPTRSSCATTSQGTADGHNTKLTLRIINTGATIETNKKTYNTILRHQQEREQAKKEQERKEIADWLASFH